MKEIVWIVLIVISLITIVPFAFIWALNTLFGLGIAYTLKTWLASFILSYIVYGNYYSKD